jgi:hypothetical protein
MMFRKRDFLAPTWLGRTPNDLTETLIAVLGGNRPKLEAGRQLREWKEFPELAARWTLDRV